MGIYKGNRPVKGIVSNYYFAFVFGFILFTSACEHDNQINTFTGELIEINYRGVDGINDSHWVEIDGVRFSHFEDLNKARQDIYSLPASIFLIRDEETDRDFRSPGADVSIAIQLGNYVSHLSKAEPDTFRYNFNKEILVANQVLMLTQGRLQLKAGDGTSFTIRAPKDYPATISIVE
jgi:hypothetical protein